MTVRGVSRGPLPDPPLLPGRPWPERPAVGALHVSRGLRGDARGAGGQPGDLPETRATPAHDLRSPRTGAWSMLLLTQISLTTSLWVMRGILFLLGLIDRPDLHPGPDERLRPDLPRRHRPRLHAVQHGTPGRERHRRRRPLDGARGRRLDPRGRRCRHSPSLTGLSLGVRHRRTLRPGRDRVLPHHPRQRRRRDHGAPWPRRGTPAPNRGTPFRRTWPDRPQRTATVCRPPAGDRKTADVPPLSNVSVFCGSHLGDRPSYATAAATLGTALAGRGMGLVYGGASVGLMGVVADAALGRRRAGRRRHHRVAGRP